MAETDSQGATAPVVDAASAVAPVTDPIVSTDSSDAGASENTEPDFDFAAFKQQLDSVQSEAATKGELANLKREAGHVPALMSRLDKLEKSLGEPRHDPRVDAVLEKLNLLIEGTSPLMDEQVAGKLKDAPLTSADIDRVVEERIAAKLKAAEEPASETEPEIDPAVVVETTIADAQWAAAGSAIVDYATKKGVDPALLTAEMYQKAQADTFDAEHKYGDPAKGAKALMAQIDKLAAATARRTDRADNASGGMSKDAQGAAVGNLTLAMMDEMSAEQLMKIPRETRDAVLRAGV